MNGSFKRQILHWWYGANIAAIQGGALSLKAFLYAGAASAAGYIPQGLDLKAGFYVFAFSFVHGLVEYLVKNPPPNLPDDPQPDSTQPKGNSMNSKVIPLALFVCLRMSVVTLRAETRGPLIPDRMPAISKMELIGLSSTSLQVPIPLPQSGSNAVAQIQQSSSFTNTTVELSIGTVASATGIPAKGVFDAHVNIGSSFYVQGEMQYDSGSSVVDVLGGGFGARKAWDTTEAYLGIEGRRNWTPQSGAKPAWEGLLKLGFAWMPFSDASNTFERNSALWAETDAVISQSSARPNLQFEGGYRYNF